MQASLSVRDLDVLEVHDCFSCNELMLYEALGLCPAVFRACIVPLIVAAQGKGGALIDQAKWEGNVLRLGGRWVVNPSGGLESKVTVSPNHVSLR
jgi:acetyl-CoA acetyltransferase